MVTNRFMTNDRVVITLEDDEKEILNKARALIGDMLYELDETIEHEDDFNSRSYQCLINAHNALSEVVACYDAVDY